MHKYQLLPRRGGKEYVLQGENGALGTLTLTNLHGGKAVITIGETAINLTRKAAIRKHVSLTHDKHGDLSFTADAFSRGTMHLHGHDYEWAPKNIRWSEWGWERSGHDILSLKISGEFRRSAGIVTSKDPLANEDDIFLALFGWYLTLLTHQSFGMQTLHALAFASARG